MAYAQSMDERWVSVSWGDDCGEIKEVASFCLGMPGTMVLQPFEDICKEIWAQTTKILSKKRIHWRISLVKVGAIDEQEIESMCLPTPLSRFECILTSQKLSSLVKVHR